MFAISPMNSTPPAKGLILSISPGVLSRAQGDRVDDAMSSVASPLAEADVTPPRRAVGRRLFRKYVALFVAVVSVALLANGAFEIWFSYRDHEASLVRIQQEQAGAAAARIEQFVADIQNQIGWTTELPWSGATLDQRRFDALRLLRQVPAITELSQLDATGHEQLRVSRLEMDVVGSNEDFSHDPRFTEAMAHKVWYGPVYFRRESEPYMTLALAGARRDAGVSVAEVNLKFIWDVVSRIKVGEHGIAYVVDGGGRLIAHPDISLVLRNTSLAGLPQVAAALKGAPQEALREASDPSGKPVLTAWAAIAPVGWYVFVELPLSEADAPLYASLARTGALLAGCLVLALVAALYLARRMTVPIEALRAGAARIGGGELSQRLSIRTGDELESLAEQFNEMAGRLAESYAGLERKVEERTHELSESLDRQTALAEVLGVISSSPGELSPVFAAILDNALRLCEADTGNFMRFDGGHLYFATMRGASPEFERLVSDELHGFVDPDSLPGQALRQKAPIHILDLRESAPYAAGVPATVKSVEVGGIRTVLCVPMLRDETPLGVLVIYRREVRPFAQKHIELVSNFAKQGVIAIENARLLTELRERTDDLQESLDFQTATSDVLKVISRSSVDLDAVLETVVTSAASLCRAEYAVLFRKEDEEYRFAAGYGLLQEYLAAERQAVIRPGTGTVIGRAAMEGRTVQIADAWTDPLYEDKEHARAGNSRAMLGVPLMREGSVVGAIGLARSEVEPYSEREVQLVTTFADQAVIAIENARLFAELRERTTELTESLEQQTATSDILQAVAESTTDLHRVMQVIADNAARLCTARDVNIYRAVGDKLQKIYSTGGISALGPVTLPIDNSSAVGRAFVEKRLIHVSNMTEALHEFPNIPPALAQTVPSVLAVPMLRETRTLGVIIVVRGEVKPFSDKQQALIASFAAQAAIAIENARLLTELRESLDRQTATADILRTIASTPGDSTRALDTIAETAARMFDASSVHVRRVNGKLLSLVSAAGQTAAVMRDSLPAVPLEPGAYGSDCILENRQILVEDLASASHDTPQGGLSRSMGIHSAAYTPLTQEGQAIGVMVVYRADIRPFQPDELELMRGFADQAVIAIENARLLSELRARTDELAQSVGELRVLGEVSQTVNSSLDLQTVLTTIVTNSAKLSQTDAGAIYVYDEAGDAFALRATFGMDDRLIAAIRGQRIRFGTAGIGEAANTRAPVQIPDLRAGERSAITDIIAEAGFRALLVVPLLRADHVVGALVVRRREPGEFAAATVELLQTFAAQSVAAIVNARLFGEIEEKGRELAIASQHKSQFLANMSHELRTPLNAILGYTELILDDIYGAAPARMREVLERVQANGKHLLGLINDVLDLSKIEAGQLVLQLGPYSVRDMLQGVYVAVEPLAANKKIDLTLDLAKELPTATGDERRLAQVVLNLVGNAIKFTDEGEVRIAARAGNGSVLVQITDTGPGIAEGDQLKIFEEFQQADNSATRAKGGTGLGLAISRRIVALHGGRLWVESEVGKGATFSVSLPVTVERQVEDA